MRRSLAAVPALCAALAAAAPGQAAGTVTGPAANASAASAAAPSAASVASPASGTSPGADSASAPGGAAAAPGDATAPPAATTARAERWLRLMQAGKPARGELSPAMNAAIPQPIADLLAAQYGPLGAPTAFTFVRRMRVRGGTAYVYRATFASQAVTWIFAIGDDGKVIGFHFYPPA